jgi:hypothetical protein
VFLRVGPFDSPLRRVIIPPRIDFTIPAFIIVLGHARCRLMDTGDVAGGTTDALMLLIAPGLTVNPDEPS